MITDIAKWNVLRNNLEYNEELEKNMLEEEEAEFIDAYKTYLKVMYEDKTDNSFHEDAILDLLTDMVDAYCDYMFVYYGTLVKQLGTGIIWDKTPKQTLMNTILTETLVLHGIKVYAQGQVPFMDKAMQFVIDANEAKPINKTKGKVKKGKEWKDPKEDIKALLRERGFVADAKAYLESLRKKAQDALNNEVIDVNDLPDEEDKDDKDN